MSNQEGKRFWESLSRKEQEQILKNEDCSWDHKPNSGQKQSFWKKYSIFSKKKKKDSSESQELF